MTKILNIKDPSLDLHTNRNFLFGSLGNSSLYFVSHFGFRASDLYSITLKLGLSGSK